MSFTWNYPANSQIYIQNEHVDEIREKLDILDDYINCNFLYDTYHSDYDLTIYSTQDIGYDSSYDYGVDGAYDYGYDSSYDYGVDSAYDSGYDGTY